MVQLLNSNYQPFVIDVTELNSYTLVGHTANQKKYYYRINDSRFSLIERIGYLAWALFKVIFTLGIALVVSADMRSQCRQAFWNKRELIILKTDSSSNQSSFLPRYFTQVGLHHFIARAQQNPSSLLGRYEQGQLQELNNWLIQFDRFSRVETVLSKQFLDIHPRYALSRLPESIGLLSSLKNLNVKLHHLRTLPESIGQLLGLQELSLTSNQLQTLPDSIGLLSSLQILYLARNQLRNFPEKINLLSSLKKLYLSENQLRVLPEGIGRLKSLQKLYLGGNRLQTLPDSIGQLRGLQELDLNRNQLQTIPDCLYQLPKSCTINLERNPLSIDEIARLQARVQKANYQGPRFIFSYFESRAHPSELESQRLENILTIWCDDSCKQKLIEHLSNQQKNALRDWLARLAGTVSYERQKQRVKEEVKQMLQWMTEETHETNLQVAHQILEDATSTCQDRVALSLNTLALHIKICRSRTLGLPELRELIIGTERYDKLYEIAEQKCRQLNAVDPLEVHLCYEIKLKDALKLPTEAQEMFYERLSGVTAVDIEAAKLQILAETAPFDKQLALLLNHPVWQEALKRDPRFTGIETDCQRQKNAFIAANEDQVEETFEEFKEKDKTTWNPFYMLTKQVLGASLSESSF